MIYEIPNDTDITKRLEKRRRMVVKLKKLTFSLPLKDQLEDMKLEENLIVDVYDLMLNQDATVKISDQINLTILHYN